MVTRLPVIDDDGEVDDLSTLDPALFKPFSVLSEALQAKLKSAPCGPKAGVTKERIAIRLSRDVVDRFRATGPGWQTRMDAALKAWLASHPTVSGRTTGS